MRCLICGTADAACGATELDQRVLGVTTNRRVGPDGNVVDVEPKKTDNIETNEPAAVADVQGDD